MQPSLLLPGSLTFFIRASISGSTKVDYLELSVLAACTVQFGSRVSEKQLLLLNQMSSLIEYALLDARFVTFVFVEFFNGCCNE
jgi:hypothetical protein